MKTTDFLSHLWLLAVQPDVVQAYWRMACSVSQTARVDPILAPGTVSGHVHNFAGGINVNPSSNHDSLQGSSCSTCEVQDDKSAYWTPKLYYEHSNGTAEEVPNGGSTVYYIGRAGNASVPAVPMPSGFRMISGNSLLRSYDTQDVTYLNNRPIADRVSFRCITEANDLAEQPYMFRTDCVNGLRAQINFPACWDGQNLYLDNSAHVAYLSDINNGVCPPSHPVPIPLLFIEVLYGTNNIDQSSGGQFTFSNGDTTGYGFHGDFMNGWNMDTFTNAVENCLYTDNNGVATACPALVPSHTYDFPRICPEAPSIWTEPVHGLLPGALPGCNPLTSGPANAPQVVCPLNSSDPSTAISNNGTTPIATSLAFNTSTSSTASLSFTTSSASPLTTSSSTFGLFNTSIATTSTSSSSDPAISSSTLTFGNPAGSTSTTQALGGIFVTNSTGDPPSTSSTTSSSTVSPSTTTGMTTTTTSASATDPPTTSSIALSLMPSSDCSGFTTVYITQTSLITVSFGSTVVSAAAATVSSPTTTSSGTSSASGSTSFLENVSSDICSLYSNLSVSGCPPPSTASANATIANTSATVTGARRLRIRGRSVV